MTLTTSLLWTEVFPIYSFSMSWFHFLIYRYDDMFQTIVISIKKKYQGCNTFFSHFQLID